MKPLYLPLVLVLGCSGLIPSGTVTEQTDTDPRCASADDRYQTWHAIGIVFTSLGTATSGSGIAAEFLTDEEWVPVVLDVGGVVFNGIGLAGNLLADDAAEDVVQYCGGM